MEARGAGNASVAGAGAGVGPSSMTQLLSTSFCCALKALCTPVARAMDLRTPRKPDMLAG